MENEILSIEWHTVKLMIKALNVGATVQSACQLLGTSDRTLYRYMKQYDIIYDYEFKKYRTLRMPEYVILKANE